MPELRTTDYIGRITWLGMVPQDRKNIRSTPIKKAFASYAGFKGDFHAGLTRPACVRVRNLHAKGTEIRNTRQLSILSAEEMAQIAGAIDLSELDPALLGTSIIIEGIPDFTLIPPGSRLQNAQGTTLVVDIENGPCNLPAREIENEAPGHGKGFKAAAQGKRGVTAWVEREGPLALGDEMRLFVPNQPVWPHLG
ncbi:MULTISPECIES: MOSC domain-containing protein [Sulfitobacter]|uniref:Metal-sulfur cluster biosynthesis proteins YuaD n=1 Tax=Sulfitobacter dubius TaxID=218673 RepID=A0ABY3ZH64_9RHOB|nr:MOSC domain-containing protein [Sulfitobacter dubius]UOA13985.1 Putative metal-sulfur cluster biosynthesis proteins YuaD [Sulfitobacter dubius]WOI30503.1 MOSC domain-containing protein [Sulfitobacter dubius]